MNKRYYCRRYKLNCDPMLVFKIREDTYDHPSLRLEPLPDDEWYWLDSVPFIEEVSSPKAPETIQKLNKRL